LICLPAEFKNIFIRKLLLLNNRRGQERIHTVPVVLRRGMGGKIDFWN
jgi:hypothetical protein